METTSRQVMGLSDVGSLNMGDSHDNLYKLSEPANGLHCWTALSEDAAEGKWVHALPVGSFRHPLHGTVSLTMERIKRFAQNVKQKVRGIDPYVNYDHRETSGEASGWIKDADARSDGLWLFVEWTKEAAQKIREGKYRYWSSEFLDEWEDPHTGQTYQDVLIGGALTNVPYLKNLVPVNLSELSDVSEQESNMDRAELAKLLGLPEDATDEQIKAKLEGQGKDTKVDLTKANIEVGEDGTIKVTHPDLEGEATHKVEKPKEKEEVTDEEKELAKLAESNPVIAKILSENQQMKEDVDQLKEATRLSEVTTQLNELGATEKKGLPPAASEKFRNIMVRLPKKFSDEVHEALVELFKTGIVELGEGGGRKPKSKQDEGDPVKKFMDEVDAKIEKDDKLTVREAMRLTANEDPELYHQYKEAVREGHVTLTEQE